MLRGYLDRLSAAPGTQARARLSATHPPSAVGVVRLRHGDPNPAGPGPVSETCPWTVTTLGPVADQPTAVGSFALIPEPFGPGHHDFALLTWVWPTHLDGEPVIFSWMAAGGPVELAVRRRHLSVVSPAGRALEAPHELRERQWYFVGVGAGEDLSIAWGALGRTGGPYQMGGPGGQEVRPAPSTPLLLGGRFGADGAPGGALDGKVAEPMLLARMPDAIGLMDIMNFGERVLGTDEVLARWAFGAAGDLGQVVALSGGSRHGSLVNAPSLGVLGPPDNAGAMAERAPDGPPFQAVHFHTDDLDDCRWPDTHVVDVPAGATSGFYALHVVGDGAELDLPFVARPRERVPVLLLAPTYTWQAYANLGRDPGEYPGLSHYALHRDGSPVYVTTRLKPAPALGPRARVEVDGVDSFIGDDEASSTGDGSHLLMADLYASWWLEHTGVDFGAITDEDLHGAGADALVGCRAVILSAHPEYWTRQMLDTLADFVERGGSVMYLGGNGLYWVTSVHPDRPHLLEVRRRAGSQTSAAPAGEDAHVFDPQPGGTWRERGPSPGPARRDRLRRVRVGPGRRLPAHAGVVRRAFRVGVRGGRS